MGRSWFVQGWVILVVSLGAAAYCVYYLGAGHDDALRALCAVGGVFHLFNAARTAYTMVDEVRA